LALKKPSQIDCGIKPTASGDKKKPKTGTESKEMI
jgi:hypothetical protein